MACARDIVFILPDSLQEQLRKTVSAHGALIELNRQLYLLFVTALLVVSLVSVVVLVVEGHAAFKTYTTTAKEKEAREAPEEIKLHQA